MTYLLQPLLRVRLFREDQAANAMTQQRKRVAAAEIELERRKKELADYQVWRPIREEEIAELKSSESVDAELEAMKAALKAKGK